MPSSKKYFPIMTETACRLKWSWSSIYLNTGATASCHRASISKLTEENFFNFHNTPQKLADRATMLKGEWPGNGCEYCRDSELAGAQSDRQFQLTIPNEHPLELNSNNQLTTVDPTTLEIFFKNTCNLACIYCNASLSSRIETEDKKFGEPLNSFIDLPTQSSYDKLSPLFWQWLDTGYNKLVHINVLGGEPLVQEDLQKLLDYITAHPNPNLTLNVITNLMVSHEILVKFLTKVQTLVEMKHLNRLSILASVDCWTEQQEYIRYGFKCSQFEQNIEYLLTQPFVTLSILSTITVLSIPTMPILAEKIIMWNKHKEVVWYTHLVLPLNTHILSPNYFDYSVFQPSFDKVLNLVNTGLLNTHESTILILTGIIEKLKLTNKPDQTQQRQLVEFLNKVDKRRNLNWQQVFPWLSEELKNVV